MYFFMPPSSPKYSRHDFLSLAWKTLLGLSSLLGLAGLFRFLSFQPDPTPPTTFDLGKASDYPAGARQVLPQAQAILIRDGSAFRAFSLICPHLGCVVKSNPQGFTCPCHGSRFHTDGSLERGPAEKPLRPLRLELKSDGHLILHTDA